MVEALNLRKTFDSTLVLDNASFRAPSGSVTALVGPNGSGKTTTLHLIAGLATPDSGIVRVDGIEVSRNRRTVAERIAFLPQDVRFHEALTPRQILRFYADLRGSDPKRIDDVLKRVDLVPAADRPCRTLSGGMRQRLGLALLLLADTDVLLLDEPALSLDPQWRRLLRNWLRHCADSGTTVIMATHLLEVWQPIVNHVLRCVDGRMHAENCSLEPVAV